MIEALRACNLFDGMTTEELQTVEAVAKTSQLADREFLFLLGDPANSLYIVAEGSVELCFPLPVGDQVRDITIETVQPGKMLGWSALVKPYRFTLTARAAGTCRLIGFPRPALLEIFEANPRIGYLFSSRIAELVGLRLISVQALWVRSLRRAFEAEAPKGGTA